MQPTFQCLFLACFDQKVHFKAKINSLPQRIYNLETVQDCLIKLGIKPRLHILEICIFSLNHVIIRPTKIMKNLLKLCKLCTFKVIFWHQKPTKSFWFFFRWELWRSDNNFRYWHTLMTLILNILYFLKMCPNFDVWYQIKRNC